ncbi:MULTISPECIES: DEAD/DEAH box helicase [Mesonia]|uniref:DNA repair helicase RadD n=1 Tax=Mesonia oceanica TaxID=2687242 RepID=A0AC61Y519_9FLAO|nr:MULTISPECIES: DEAD/DEAH box helicase [Mesonia]MAN28767.1 DEAD/DEAH box helicase [Mesonia sp.]MAQ41902.1 DEAD/DEAH box helicase [Mesonia sp.]MBJ98977.1 DEAD/DEAH box helicase [Flavobacteriaceae bacterium]VVU99172.1 Putative DNA repair helicase RadD [Mesonia oceanica]|tara:strand:+ start:6482 stop:7981 length:1500 start_codon:yes stop_codon:yes gene_type:complete
MAEKVAEKTLYDYQEKDLNKIFEYLEEESDDFNLLYQLPTGGGKTVVFSEIIRRYIEQTNKKVVILTHRIELCKQTSKMLNGFGVRNKIINSKVKELPDQDEYQCFVAMVETLNNRLSDDKLEVSNVGLVIIDEAHYNSFTKLFKYFEKSFILGVTATPLSSNIKLPMKDNYKELIVGESIPSLINKGFLARANTFSYDVGLTSLQVGINGDYTVKSSEDLYTNFSMQEKLMQAYEERCKGKKTLIFNNGINTSWYVYQTFKDAGYEVKHLDNTHSKKERKEILRWFREKPDAILTSVSILTTGFDEPSVENIILNRATKSLTLYYQMIGRGSRKIPNKDEFNVIDLGNNAARFGLWDAPVDWHLIFKNPDYFLENIVSDEDIEREFKYRMPEEVRELFKNTENIDFDIKEEYESAVNNGEKSKMVLEKSIDQHAQMCAENSEDVFDARILARELKDDIRDRVKRYSRCIINNTKNYRDWLFEDYNRKLRSRINEMFQE